MTPRTLASLLEGGALNFPGAKVLEATWAAWMARAIARPIPTPAGTRLVTVGGATLGGSGKTPLAIALAREFAKIGESVALVGHAYGAKPARARVVLPNDDVREVGDEALVAARALESAKVPVVVAPDRAAAVHFAATMARTLVVDGALQARPTRAHRSFLALDAKAPWGAGVCPPRGDLRAPPEHLLAACDAVVTIGDEEPNLAGLPERPILRARSWLASEGLVGGAGTVPLATLATGRLGLLSGLARPERVTDSLAKLGVGLRYELRFRDHAFPSKRFLDEAAMLAKRERLDAWLATEKCATRLPQHVGNVPVIALRHELRLFGFEVNSIERA